MENRRPKLRYVPSFACSAHCPYCHREGLVAEEEVNLVRLSRLADAFRNAGFKEVTFAGGEPLPWEKLFPVIDLFDKKGFHLAITTTGMGVKDQILQDLLQVVHNVHLSVPSFDTRRYHTYVGVPFTEFEQLLDYLLETGVSTRLNHVVTRGQAAQWENALEYAVHKNVDICLQDVVWSSRLTPGDYERLFVDVLELVQSAVGLRWTLQSGYVPRLVAGMAGICVEVKATQLSRVQRYSICDHCRFDAQCAERICALRIYPSGRVGTCLEGPQQLCWAGQTEDVESVVHRMVSAIVGGTHNCPAPVE